MQLCRFVNIIELLNNHNLQHLENIIYESVLTQIEKIRDFLVLVLSHGYCFRVQFDRFHSFDILRKKYYIEGNIIAIYGRNESKNGRNAQKYDK